MQSPAVAERLSSSTTADAAAAVGLGSPLCPLPAVVTPSSACMVLPHADGRLSATGDPTPAMVANPNPKHGQTLIVSLGLGSVERWVLDEGRALADLPAFEGAMLRELARGASPALGLCDPDPLLGQLSCTSGVAGAGSGESANALPCSLEACSFLGDAGELSTDYPPWRYA